MYIIPQSKIERARERLNAFLSGERGPYEGLTGDIAVILTAEPSRVEDTEVEEAIKLARAWEDLNKDGDEDLAADCGNIADLIRRLAAAKASAERERDVAETRREAAEWALKNTDATMRAETAEAKLREARGLALEEAAKVVETIADDRFREHGSTEPDTNASYYQGSQAEFYEAQDEENENCVTAIRALKQRSQT